MPALILRSLMLTVAVALTLPLASRVALPFETVFKGGPKFAALVAQADAWKSLPIGERTAAVGRALAGTPYKSYTLEIDDRNDLHGALGVTATGRYGHSMRAQARMPP